MSVSTLFLLTGKYDVANLGSQVHQLIYCMRAALVVIIKLAQFYLAKLL